MDRRRQNLVSRAVVQMMDILHNSFAHSLGQGGMNLLGTKAIFVYHRFPLETI
jgi:hypothetical protein